MPTPGDCPTARQQAGVTTDDRAMLLPGRVRESPEVDIQPQVKSSIVDANREVYTITDESLPSHMRSLLPSHEQQVHDLLTLERTRRRLRYVIISLTVMLALTVLVAVALVFSLRVRPVVGMVEGARYKGSSSPSRDAEVAEVATEVKISLLSRNRRPSWTSVYRHIGPVERRTPCVTECWTYAAFRFRSDCQDGFCQCHGDNYDTNTCLPKYQECHIKKNIPRRTAVKLFGKNQTTYSCRLPSRDADGVHVVSIFGNHRASTTLVTVKGQSPSRKILVLVNYHLVKWTVRLPRNSGISKIFVVSMKRSCQPDRVAFQGSPDDPEVEVFRRLSLTGYGEDRNGGHTPQLLQYVEEEIGPLASFLGAAHADEITLDLDDEITSTTSIVETSTQR